MIKDRVGPAGGHVFKQIIVRGEPSQIPSDEDIQLESLDIGMPLSRTYICWCTTFGRGHLDDLLEFWVPVRSLPDRLSAMCDGAEVVVDDVRAGFAEYSPDGSEKIALRLVYFGHSFDGGFLAWDPHDVVDDEPAIYSVGRASLSFTKVGYGMDRLIASLLSADVKRVLGLGYQPLTGTFCARPPS